MLLAIIALCVGPFIVKGEEGKPLMSLSSVKMPSLRLPELSPLETGLDTMRQLVHDDVSDQNVLVSQIFKWKDDNGVWHFTQEKPEGVENVIRVIPNVSTVTNSGALKKLNESETSLQSISTDLIPALELNDLPGLSTLIDEANAAKQAIGDHVEKQQTRLNNVNR